MSIRFNKLVVLFLLSILIVTTPALASTLDCSVGGLNLSSIEIESFTIILDVEAGFSLTDASFGNSIPDPVSLNGWQGDFILKNEKLTISNANFDYLVDSLPNPLQDGDLFSITFDGNILGFSDILFFDSTGINTFDMKITNEDNWLTDGSVNFAPVPIPPAILLLGGGLLGMLGIRRKIKQ
jgi:hypothetical protein